MFYTSVNCWSLNNTIHFTGSDAYMVLNYYLLFFFFLLYMYMYALLCIELFYTHHYRVQCKHCIWKVFSPMVHKCRIMYLKCLFASWFLYLILIKEFCTILPFTALLKIQKFRKICACLYVHSNYMVKIVDVFNIVQLGFIIQNVHTRVSG